MRLLQTVPSSVGVTNGARMTVVLNPILQLQLSQHVIWAVDIAFSDCCQHARSVAGLSDARELLAEKSSRSG